MKPPIIILAPFLTLIFSGHVHSHSVHINPERATGIVGGEVQINCEVEYGPNFEMSWDFNEKFVYIITFDKENYPLGNSKFFVHRTGMNFTLTIKDLRLEDGGKYWCTSYTSEASASLVVLDFPSLTLNPSADLSEGQTVIVTCEARFGGPKKDLILPGHSPNIKMYYVNKNSKKEMESSQAHYDVNGYYLISKKTPLKLQSSMNKQNITCVLETTEPLMNTIGVTVLNVLYSVRDILITPDKERYEVGDNISCIADSNPAAVHEWKEVQEGTPIYSKWLKITESMIGKKWECVARNEIYGKVHVIRRQASFLAVDSSISENGAAFKPAFVAAMIVIAVLLLAIYLLWKKSRKTPKPLSRNKKNEDVPENSISIPIDPPGSSGVGAGTPGSSGVGAGTPGTVRIRRKTAQTRRKQEPPECIELLRSVTDKNKLDQHGEEILRILKEDGESIKQYPDIFIRLIRKAKDLIDSKSYVDIIKLVPYGDKDSPLKYLLQHEETWKKLSRNQNKLLSVIQSITKYGDIQSRTECLRDIIITREFRSSGIKYRFEWSEEYLSTLKDLLEKGADPTWIDPEDFEKEREWRTNAQNEFFHFIFDNLWEKNDLHESLLQVLPLMLSWKCKDNKLLVATLLHRFVDVRLDYIATNRGSMPPNFFRQFRNILSKILIDDETLLVQKDYRGMTPLQHFLIGIKLEESIFGEVREIIQMLQTQEVLSSQNDWGRNALHDLAYYFPVIRGEVSQRGRESFLELVKSFANGSNVGCQDENGRTALHFLAEKFPGGISEESREVYQDFVKHLATYDILEIKDKDGRTALHYLADGFRFDNEEWKMETFVEVLKCLAVPRTICIKDKNGNTALEMISNDWGNEVPEHYKDKFKEISDILSENN